MMTSELDSEDLYATLKVHKSFEMGGKKKSPILIPHKWTVDNERGRKRTVIKTRFEYIEIIDVWY